MPDALELEVTIRIVVDRDCFPGLTDEQICNVMTDAEVVMSEDWQSVSVRVAEVKGADRSY